MQRAAVLGAGPAGVLIATILARHGIEPILIDPSARSGGKARPQVNHAHMAQPEVLAGLRALIPNLDISAAGPIDRADLDQALLEMVSSHGFGSVVRRIRQISFNGDTAQLPELGEQHFRFIIDASGCARVSMRSLPVCASDVLSLYAGDARHSYASYCFNADLAARFAGPWVAQNVESDTRAIIAIGRHRTILTLQFPTGSRDNPCFSLARSIVREMGEPAIHDLCQGAELLSGPHLFAPRAPICIACSDIRALPPSWLPFGDALLCTPPTHALGLWQIVQQASLVDAGLAAGDDIDRIRRRLFDFARGVWEQTVLREAAQSLKSGSQWTLRAEAH